MKTPSDSAVTTKTKPSQQFLLLMVLFGFSGPTENQANTVKNGQTFCGKSMCMCVDSFITG